MPAVAERVAVAQAKVDDDAELRAQQDRGRGPHQPEPYAGDLKDQRLSDDAHAARGRDAHDAQVGEFFKCRREGHAFCFAIVPCSEAKLYYRVYSMAQKVYTFAPWSKPCSRA